MPRAKRFHLAQKLAIVALGAAALAIGTGQLPALAYGGPPPPPAPGGYTAVVTSQTIGPDGGVIGPVRVGACSVALTVPRGTFKSQVQITITAPTVQDIGDGGQPGYRAVCGVGVLIQVDGTALHRGVRPRAHPGHLGDQHHGTMPGSSCGTAQKFVPVAATIAGPTVRVSFSGSNEDFAVLVPGGGSQSGSSRTEVATASRGNRMAGGEVLTSLFIAPPGLSPAGIGVLAPEWLAEISQ